ncbi:hypothetical protein EVAR_88846_1 [Eumeta japonica]|uniref:Uncharacterized protein n=1 Tax=Eumeta variegata TaxID=151549 RepID=A0A4C1Y3A7_EUMVA|nr:hypothetical protein EVAR_88846_1 [Eumeta japonica]
MFSGMCLYREAHSTDLVFSPRHRRTFLTQTVRQISATAFELVKQWQEMELYHERLAESRQAFCNLFARAYPMSYFRLRSQNLESSTLTSAGGKPPTTFVADAVTSYTQSKRVCAYECGRRAEIGVCGAGAGSGGGRWRDGGGGEGRGGWRPAPAPPLSRDKAQVGARAPPAATPSGRAGTLTRPTRSRPPPAMLHSLNALAGKISPGGGLDSNANRASHPNRNHAKPAVPAAPAKPPNTTNGTPSGPTTVTDPWPRAVRSAPAPLRRVR